MRENSFTKDQAFTLAHHCFDKSLRRTAQLKVLDRVIARQNPWVTDFPVLSVQRDRDLIASLLTPRQELIRKRLRETITGNVTRAIFLMGKYDLTMEQIYQTHKEECLI